VKRAQVQRHRMWPATSKQCGLEQVSRQAETSKRDQRGGIVPRENGSRSWAGLCGCGADGRPMPTQRRCSDDPQMGANGNRTAA